MKAQGKKTKAAPPCLKKSPPLFPNPFYPQPNTNPHTSAQNSQERQWGGRERERERAGKGWRGERHWRVIEPRRKQKSTAYRGRQRGLETLGRGAEKIPWKRLADAREGAPWSVFERRDLVIRAAELKKLDPGDIGVKRRLDFPVPFCCIAASFQIRAAARRKVGSLLVISSNPPKIWASWAVLGAPCFKSLRESRLF